MSVPAFHNDAMASTVGDVLKLARKGRGKRQKDVADAARVTVQAVSQWERGDNDISMEKLRAVADYLRFDAVKAYRGELSLDADGDMPSEVERVTDPGPVEVGPLDVDVLGLAVGGDDADFTFNGEVVDRVRRPPGLAHLKNVFALHVIGTSMSPRYEPGELIYCGGRPPIAGEDCVIELFPTEDSPAGKGFIKRLVRRAGGKITVKQFSPETELDFDAYAIKSLHRVIPWREVLGF